MNAVGLTSRWVAANRALETEFPNRLYEDRLARPLAGNEGFALLAQTQVPRPGVPANTPEAYLSIRTRFFDDALVQAAQAGPLRQIAILAAGMDSRAFRLQWPPGTTVFEVDQADVIDYKEAVLSGLNATPSCSRCVVRANLEQDWTIPLIQAGFDPNSPAAFLVEGLLPYLDESAVELLIAALAALARPGSWLGLDVVTPELLSSPYMTTLLEKLTQLGCPWRFGTAEPEKLLARYGWEARAIMPGEPEANFGRWPYPALPRNTPGIPRSFLVTAKRLP
jgi:methyltransferase (TIGR00027 family)